jgi:hypothetical protein
VPRLYKRWLRLLEVEVEVEVEVEEKSQGSGRIGSRSLHENRSNN